MNAESNSSTPGGEPFAHLLHYGLARTLQAHSEELRAKHPRVALDLDLVDDEGLVDETACRVLYRVFTEAMKNILKREPAEGDEPAQVSVRYSPTGQGAMVFVIRSEPGVFSIKDDWARFQRGALGVMGLKPHLEKLGGDLEIHAPEGAETVIEAKVGI